MPSQYDIAPPDLHGLQELFGDPEMRKKALALYAASSPEEKELTDTVASAVAQKPDAVSQIAETVAPNGIKAITAKTDVSPVPDNRRAEFMARYEKQKAADKGEYDKGVATADSGRENARWSDFTNHIVSGFGRAAAAYGGDKDNEAFYRDNEAKNDGSNVKAIDAKKAELAKWLKEKQKLGNDDYTTGLHSLDSEGKEKVELGRLDLAKLLGQNTIAKTNSDITNSGVKLEQGDATLEQGDKKLTLQEKEMAMRDARERARIAAGAARSEAKKGEKDAKQEREDKKLAVPGWELTGEVIPSQLEAREARDSVKINGEMTQGISRLISMGQKYGAKVLPDAEKAQALALVRDLQLSAKGKALYELGVLTGPDMSLLEAVLPNPTDPSFKTMTGANMAALKETLNSANRRLENRLTSLGYKRGAMGTATGSSGADTAVVQQKMPDGSLGPKKPLSRKSADALIKAGLAVEAK